MKNSRYFTKSANAVHLAIDPKRLESLIGDGSLNVTDFSCLDMPSKKNVWAMLSSLAAKRLVR
jgi:hypothetical protein